MQAKMNPSTIPVSYTHLDVYKRQYKTCIFLRSRFQACSKYPLAMPSSAMPSISALKTPYNYTSGHCNKKSVSYTHLDVYKRQGKALQEAGMQAVLKAIPADRFFVETDDASISIAEIYALAATARQISIEELSLQLHKNFETVFKRIV